MIFTSSQPASIQDYERHLNGKMGLGVVPITDDNSCYFGVIDINNHGMSHDLPLAE
jgi:hypothetical protein